jgi:4-hydroxybenzoate polyprenyltransferase
MNPMATWKRAMNEASLHEAGVVQAESRAGFRAIDMLRLLRPGQWTKNVLVFAAPLFAARLFQPAVLSRTLMAFGAMCLASSFIYVINDVVDADKDRSHPLKSRRPVATRAVTVSTALRLAALLAVMALALAWLSGAMVMIGVGAYMAIMLGYCLRGRETAPLDVILVASGFVIRAIVGAAAGQVPASPYFLALTMLLALMLGFGKRRAEWLLLGDQERRARPSLNVYTPAMLDQFLGMLAASSVVLYAIYAISVSRRLGSGDMILTWPLVVVGLIRYLQLSHHTERPPDELLVSDRVIVATVLAFGLIAGAILYFHTHLLQPVAL